MIFLNQKDAISSQNELCCSMYFKSFEAHYYYLKKAETLQKGNNLGMF